MSHEEPRRDILPSRLADAAPPSALFGRADGRGDTTDRFRTPEPAPRASTAERFGRAFRRHWWQILPLWAAASAAVWYGLPRWFPNTYEATSVVQVDAGSGAGGRGRKGDAEFETLKETEARRLTNPTIVKDAVADTLDLGKDLAEDEKTDPETAILRGLSATLLPKTDLIQVTMTAPHDRNLAGIVNGVITRYLKVANEFTEAGVTERSFKLKNLTKAKENEVRRKQEEVARMLTRTGALDAAQGREQHAAAIEQRATLSDQLLKTDLEVVELQATAERVRQEEAAIAATPRPPQARTEAEAATAFYLLPEVAALKKRRDELNQKLELAKNEPAKTGDASRKTLQPQRDDLQRQINELWLKLSPGLMIAAQAEPAAPVASESSRLEARINGLKARQTMLNDRLEKTNKDNLTGGSDVLALEFARQDLARAEKVYGMMTETLSQAEVVSSEPPARFMQLNRARTTEKSQHLPRWAIGTIAPAAILLGLLGFFGMVEQRAGRILDPSDLPIKARLNVIGLVPPLPRGRGRLGLTSTAGQRSQVDVERFIQSLDQLRVIVCGRGDAQGRLRRSLLITSAGQGEGKSTLAAQLAERSVNAGLLTLLIDADLRNPTLSRMFDRPESIGLANVLRGELLAEEAIGTVPEAGGFHFLSAGLVRDDLARLLGSERLARLLESARESFDLVLVDSPPVLPVADALTIGQWVDGAIITVRHKVSRLPMVERATQQLASVGITVLGAVVSGIKDRHAPYYGPRDTPEADRQGSEL